MDQEYTGGSTSYDRLDFARPRSELKPHYHSTNTLRSAKSRSPLPDGGGSPPEEEEGGAGRRLLGGGDDEGGFSRGQEQGRHSAGHLSQGEIPKVMGIVNSVRCCSFNFTKQYTAEVILEICSNRRKYNAVVGKKKLQYSTL